MKKYYFTFGMNHMAPEENGKPYRSLFRYYVTIEAEDMGTARGIMFARYKDKWSFCYEEHQFEDAIGQFGLTEFERIIQDQPVKSV